MQGLGKTMLRGLAGDLLWRRFSPLRSAMMPMRVLEQQVKSGKEKTKRKELLKTAGLSYCVFLTVWGIALETALLAGEILFFAVMADLFARGFIVLTTDFIINAEIYIFTAWCINYMLIETLYVCMGFSLYINSRINAEGWDIEIMFRSFAEKLKNKKNFFMIIILCLVFMFIPEKISSDGWESSQDAPLELLQKIFDSPEFGGEKDTWNIRLKKPFEQVNIPDIQINPMTERLRIIFASVLRFIVISLFAILAVFLFIYARKLVNERNTSVKKSSMTVLRGIPGKNPDDILKDSVNFFEQGNLRMAWGYCTAAAILSWSLCRSPAFPLNATESDCADMVRSMHGSHPDAQDFCTLINHWINFAYAGQLPPEGSFEKAAAFCRRIRTVNG
jgi:hypothetical protein